VQDASSKQQTKQKYKPNHHQTGLPIRGKKQKNKQNSAQISAYTKLTQINGPTLEGQKPKERKNSTLKSGKRRSQTQEVKKNNEKAEEYYTTQMKEQTRNTEVQIN